MSRTGSSAQTIKEEQRKHCAPRSLGPGDMLQPTGSRTQHAMENRTAHYQGRAGHAGREGVRTMQSIAHPASWSLITPIHMTGMR